MDLVYFAFVTCIAAILIIAGFIGLFVPIVPDTPFIFLGLLVVAWADHFQHIGWRTLLSLALICIVSVGVDLLSSAYGAKRAGASALSVWGALLGTAFGFFFPNRPNHWSIHWCLDWRIPVRETCWTGHARRGQYLARAFGRSRHEVCIERWHDRALWPCLVDRCLSPLRFHAEN